MRAPLVVLLGLMLLAGSPACGPTSDAPTGDGGTHPDRTSSGSCTNGTKQCDSGNSLQTCQNGKWVTGQMCPAACDPSLGCVACTPNGSMCQGNNVLACDAHGNPGAVIAQCQGNCANGACDDPCGQAEANKSYLGCDYYPTVTMNSQLNAANGFNFAVAVANTGGADAQLTITGGALTAAKNVTVAPGQLQTITLPWVDALRQSFNGGAQTEASVLAPNGAYHLVSTQPVTVYQFNALEYKMPTTVSCSDASCDTADGIDACENNVCVHFSYTNDASLLLPRHVLGATDGTSSYLVIARPTMELYSTGPLGGRQSTMWSPGFFAVVGTQDGTQVNVGFTANTLAGAGGLQAYGPGSSGTFTLDQGTVLMIASGHNDSCTGGAADAAGYSYCDLASGYDLTGTEITSDKPVAVFSGHNCDFIPYNKWACDHLEQQLFPVTAWGKHYVATKVISTADPNLYRVLSGHDGNQITFEPPVSDQLTNTTLTSITLDKGQWKEFVTAQDFEVAGDQGLLVAGFMVGQNYASATGAGAPGDPAMCLMVPSEQYRTSYTFLAPESYSQNYVNIVAKTGSTISLDGTEVGGWTQVGTGEWSVSKQSIQGGTHTISTTGSDGFGIEVYGVGSYTSYMFPGGLDVKAIDIPG